MSYKINKRPKDDTSDVVDNKSNNNDDNEIENEEKKVDNNADEYKKTKEDIKGMINALSSCPLMIPFWQKILQCDRILIAGCGGGYDCFQGIVCIKKM